MEYTAEYELGWEALAKYFGFQIQHYPHFNQYTLPSHWKNGWIYEVHPTEGLFTASAWFTPEKDLSYTMNINQPCLWFFCIDSGDINMIQNGKAKRTLGSFHQLVINPLVPFRIVFRAGVQYCFTSVLIFDAFIEKFLNTPNLSYPIRIEDAKHWKPHHMDTTQIMLIMEQIRWGIRGYQIPVPAYILKATELLYVIAHNAEREDYRRSRRQYVTWNDKMKLYRVKERIDMDPLEPPTLNEMCRLSEMSESKLRLCFKSQYNQTLYNYQRETLMKRAMQMLAFDELSIKNIAQRCGYENPAKFAAAFKKVNGITPSEFRKNFGL